MKIKKSVIKPISTIKVFGINTIPVKKFKYTKEETLFAMRSAMRLRSRAAKKWNCKVSEISLSLCLKESYRRIVDEKLTMSGILTKENKKIVKKFVEKEFGFHNIDTLIRKKNIHEIVPNGIMQNVLLNFAKLEMKTRMMEV